MKKLKLLLLLLSGSSLLHAQAPHGWQLLNPATDSVAGVAANAAYQDLLKNAKSTPVIVAVIDGGTDLSHPDLKQNAWINEKEIPGNGIDDDHNGYVDDVNGWDFIGGKNASVDHDNLEITRLCRAYRTKFNAMDTTKLSGQDKKDFDTYKKMRSVVSEKRSEAQSNQAFYGKLMSPVKKAMKDLGDNITKEKLDQYNPTDPDAKQGKSILMTLMANGADPSSAVSDLQEAYDYFGSQADYQYNLDYDPRNIVGDNYADLTEKNYGNNDVKGPEALHGTHVAGIIGAVRDNRLGIDGVADNVKIMVVRVVPDGDERDKDVANGIRYAVDNGAKVINMSFGKPYSPYKADVDAAVQYAVQHDVLLVHAAGNDSKNIDKEKNFPTRNYLAKGAATSWIEVGAIQPDFNPATFSNYGQKNVDLFAPGTEIYSTVADGGYKIEQGTSMASPVCAGVAAMIRSYFPSLTAVQVKDILMKSVTPVKQQVTIPGGNKKTSLKSLCVSGGVVNAYKAVQLAQKMTAK